MEKNKIKPFTESDWDGFAGAEEFGPRNPPLIAESENGLIVIGDVNGIGVFTGDDPEDEGYSLHLENATEAQVRALMEGMPENITEAVLNDWGFRKIKI